MITSPASVPMPYAVEMPYEGPKIKGMGGHNLPPPHSDSNGPIVSNKSDLSTFDFLSFYWFK